MAVTTLKFWRHPKNPRWSRVYVNDAKRRIYFAYDVKTGGVRVEATKDQKRPNPVSDRRLAEQALNEHGLHRSINDPELGRTLFIYAQATEKTQAHARRVGILYASTKAGAPPGLKLADGAYYDVPDSWPLQDSSRGMFARAAAM